MGKAIFTEKFMYDSLEILQVMYLEYKSKSMVFVGNTGKHPIDNSTSTID